MASSVEFPAVYSSMLTNMVLVKLWYIRHKCHSIKSTVTVIWAITCVYKVTFLDWNGLWSKRTWEGREVGGEAEGMEGRIYT